VNSILVSEGGSGESRAALAAVRALSAAGYRTTVTVDGPRSLAASSRHTTERLRVPSVHTDPAGYAAAVRAELDRHVHLDVLCCSDAALLALERPVGDLLDKELTGRAAAAAGLRVPTTEVFASREELLAAGHRLPYPIAVKPAIKRFLAVKVDRAQDLVAAVPADHEARLLVQPWLQDNLRGVIGVVWDHEIVQAAHLRYERVWPYPCGTVSAAISTDVDPWLEEALTRLLGGYQGPFHVDLAGDHLLDVNPRVHATTPLALAGGVNLPATYAELLQGRSVARRRVRPGLRFRWEEGDVRSIVRQRRAGELSRAEFWNGLRPRPRTTHSVVSIADPLPTLERGRYLIERLRRPERIEW
jgi:hypothetical protein